MMQLDHDLHVHTYLSACCGDKENHTPANILAKACELGLKTIGFTDHVWVNPDVAPSDWYRPQDETQIGRLRDELAEQEPFAGRILVGCEAETIAPGTFGITPALAESLDYVLLACSHFHMTDFVAQPESRTPVAVARHLVAFFRSAVTSGLADIIPHPFIPCGYLELYDATIAAISDAEFLDVFGSAVERGVAIEITPASLPQSAGGFPRSVEWNLDTPVRVLTLARDAGVRFCLGTDSHLLTDMDRLPRLQQFIDAADLTDQHFRIPAGVVSRIL